MFSEDSGPLVEANDLPASARQDGNQTGQGSQTKVAPAGLRSVIVHGG